MTNFSSLNTALSALRYQQGVLDVASTNVANVATEGYVRRRLPGETVGSAPVPALWSRTNEIGNGVASSGVQRITDALLDARLRREHATQSSLDLKAEVLARLETGIAEPGNSGVAAAISEFKAALHDLVNNPGSEAARSQVLSSAAIVADAFNLQSANFAGEAADQRVRVLDNVSQVNDLTTQLADTNRTIAAAAAVGGDASTLLDTRDRLAMRLAELTGATAEIQGDGTMEVTLNGSVLVSGTQRSELAIATGIAVDGSSTGAAITFSLTDSLGTTTPYGGTLGGEIGAGVTVIDEVIPDYVAGLDKVAADLATAVNAVQVTGYDAAGNLMTGEPIFGFDVDGAGDPVNAASSLTVALSDPMKLAASSVANAPADSGNATKMIEAITVGDAYQRLVNGFGTQVNSAKQLANNQRVMTAQVESARDQLTGVSLDEETVTMVLAQRAYEAAARVMTTVDSMLDTLINRTGRVGL